MPEAEKPAWETVHALMLANSDLEKCLEKLKPGWLARQAQAFQDRRDYEAIRGSEAPPHEVAQGADRFPQIPEKWLDSSPPQQTTNVREFLGELVTQFHRGEPPTARRWLDAVGVIFGAFQGATPSEVADAVSRIQEILFRTAEPSEFPIESPVAGGRDGATSTEPVMDRESANSTGSLSPPTPAQHIQERFQELRDELERVKAERRTRAEEIQTLMTMENLSRSGDPDSDMRRLRHLQRLQDMSLPVEAMLQAQVDHQALQIASLPAQAEPPRVRDPGAADSQDAGDDSDAGPTEPDRTDDEALDGSPAARSNLPDRLLRKHGTTWEVRFDGELGGFPDLKGFRLIRNLMRSPRTGISALELDERPHNGGADTLISPQEVDDLLKQLADAKQNHDSATEEALKKEIRELTDNRGKPRCDPRSPKERARKNVRNRIHDALGKLKDDMPGLRNYLLRAISFGETCSFTPPENDGPWVLS